MKMVYKISVLAFSASVLLLLIGLVASFGSAQTSQPTAAPPIPTATLVHCVDLNTANGNQLEHLPGIGPTLAWRIAEHIAVNGPFETVDDLANVDGISDETVDGLRHLVCEELAQE